MVLDLLSMANSGCFSYVVMANVVFGYLLICVPFSFLLMVKVVLVAD